MHPLPHRYHVRSHAGPDGEVVLRHPGAADLASMPPPEFGGPGGHWSPEALLVGAIADCYALTFRALARARSLPWTHLDCAVEGVLERASDGLRFTGFSVHARLQVPAGVDAALAERLLHEAEQRCLVSNSLKAIGTLQAHVEIVTA